MSNVDMYDILTAIICGGLLVFLMIVVITDSFTWTEKDVATACNTGCKLGCERTADIKQNMIISCTDVCKNMVCNTDVKSLEDYE